MQYFGQLGHMAGKDEETVCVKEDLGVSELLAEATREYSTAFHNIVWDAQGKLRPSLMVLVNDEAVDKQNLPVLRDCDRVLLVPAIAGG